MKETKVFFKYVIPSILSFALSGVYAIVDGFFVGNSVGDIGLSAINVAYPITAVLQAMGTGIGMGGAVYYTIKKAAKNEKQANNFAAGAFWLMIIASVFLTFFLSLVITPALKLLGAQGNLLTFAKEYISIIVYGAGLQVIGTGLIPFIRNRGGSFYAMISMIAGFFTNFVLNYLFIWVFKWGLTGAAMGTVIGQGVTVLLSLLYLLHKKLFTLNIHFSEIPAIFKSIIKIGIAPFGLAMTPNISLIIINRFSLFYGGEKAIATYSCISYVITIVYLILQGVGDGSQPIISRYYGEGKVSNLKEVRKLAYITGLFLSFLSCVIMYFTKGNIGVLFGASAEVNVEIQKIIPIYLVSIPFVSISRIITSVFYAIEESLYSYILTFMEPSCMLVLMLILPPLLGGQIMIWWSIVIARILSACLALVFNLFVDRKKF